MTCISATVSAIRLVWVLKNRHLQRGRNEMLKYNLNHRPRRGSNPRWTDCPLGLGFQRIKQIASKSNQVRHTAYTVLHKVRKICSCSNCILKCTSDFLKVFFKEMPDDGLYESKHVAMYDMTLKCCVGRLIFVCLWYRKTQPDASEYKRLHFTLLQTDRLQATAFYDSLLHNRHTYCGVPIRITNYLRG